MINDAKNGMFDLILTKEISRFSRNTVDSIQYTKELLSYGVGIYFLNDNLNTFDADSELRLTIMSSIAQEEIRRLSERVRFGYNRTVEKGVVAGSNNILGYKKDNGKLVIVPEEAETVKIIFNEYSKNSVGTQKLGHYLYDKYGIKSKTGKPIQPPVILKMIRNPKYKGYYCARKSEIVDYMTKKIKYFEKDNWIIYEDKMRISPIIDEDLWNRANSRLMMRKKAFSKRKEDKSIYKNRYLYSTKIYCAEHNAVFHRRQFRKNKKDITWVCSLYLKNGKSTCDSPNIRESELNAIFKDLISKLQIDSNKIVDILMNYYKHLEIDNGIDENIILLEKEINNLYAKKDKLLELSLQESLSNTEFYEKNNSFNEKIKVLKNELNKLKNEKNELKGTTDKTKELVEILKQKVNSKFTINKIISLLLDHIIVSKIYNDKNNMKLNIYLSYKETNESKRNQPVLRDSYKFKRGYDTQGAKRYNVNYQVNCYFCL